MTRPPPLSPNAWLRWGLFKRLMSGIEGISSVLEVGCGKGAMGYRLALNYQYRGYEPDIASFRAASERMDRLEQGQVINAVLPVQPDRAFDLLFASEVLEHIEDDVAALGAWSSWLASGGHVLLSVPADPTRFGPADRAVGHFRRYARQDLIHLLEAAGFEPVEVWAYGFPLGYLLDAFRNRMAAEDEHRPSAAGTAASGRWHQPTERMGLLTMIGTAPFRLVQAPLLHTDLGTGLVALGRRSE
jgi:SAM-dependent methyltransferase